MAVDEIAKRRAMALDAERVGQRQRDLMPGGMGDCGGLAKRLLRQRRVEQIAFEIGHLSRADGCRRRCRRARAPTQAPR